MKFKKHHEQVQLLKKHVCITLKKCNVFFLDSQINNVVWMLMRIYEMISLTSAIKSKLMIDVVHQHLRSVQTKKNFIVDIMNLKKTFLTLLYLFYMTLHESRKKHKSILILTSSAMILNQWMKIIQNHFQDLIVIVAHEAQSSKLRLTQNWMFVKTVREISNKIRKWSARL